MFLLVALGVSGTGPGDTPEEVAEWYADDGNRGAAFFVFFLLAGGGSPSSGSSARSEACSSAPRATRPAGRL